MREWECEIERKRAIARQPRDCICSRNVGAFSKELGVIDQASSKRETYLIVQFRWIHLREACNRVIDVMMWNKLKNTHQQ